MPPQNDKKTSTPFTNHPCFFFFLGGVHVRTIFFPERYHSQTWQTKNPRWPCHQGTQHRNNPSARVPYLLGSLATQGGHKTWRKQRAGCKLPKVGHLGHVSWFLCKQADHQIYPNLPLKQQITNHTFIYTDTISSQHPSIIHHPSPKSGQFFPIIPTTWTFFRHFFWG